MSRLCRFFIPFILPVLLATVSGCQTPSAGTRDQPGGFLLQTGAIQLGPGVGKNLWGWQSDGHSGFFGSGSESGPVLSP